MSVYYVKVDGSDAQTGLSDSSAWATWQKAFNEASAGDIVYFKGGTWYPTTKAYGVTGVTVIDPVAVHGRNGTSSQPICFFADPSDYAAGNIPILDCSFITDASYGNIGLVIQNATYLQFKGLTVCNSRMYNTTANSGGISAADVSVLYFENMTSHGNGGPGYWMRTYSEVYFINCDSYNNCDASDAASPGGGGDGFALSSRGAATDLYKKTYVYGCRSWLNSDDGFDIGSTKQLYVYNTWSFNNGKLNGDGTGFKFSYSHILDLSKRIVYNCITAYNHTANNNEGAGYTHVNLYDSVFGPYITFYNNLSYKDYSGFPSADSWSPYNYFYYRALLNNNIAFSPTSGILATFKAADYTDGVPSYATLNNNTFIKFGIYGNTIANPTISVSDNDFSVLPTDASDCMAILSAPRKSNGALPDISIFHLASGSNLIGAGINLGLLTDVEGTPWKNPPSLGPFEYDGDSSTLTIDISTSSITDISSYTATCGGSLNHDGSIALTYRGICWRSTIENPTVFDSSVRDTSTGEGSYVSYLTNLNANTRYHVKAFAYNSDGIAYGQDVSFYTLPGIPTVLTLAAINISTNCASSYSYLQNDGSSSIINKGVCWNTSINPTILNSYTQDGSITGGYVSHITGLYPNTVYFIRAYATNAYGTAYGIDVSFNTLDTSTSIPSVTTTSITDISTYSASAVGIVTHDGSLSLTYRGFCVSTNASPTYLDVSVRSASTGEGTYTLSLSSLSASTHYYVRAFAYNSQGTAYGSDVSFNTLSANASTSNPVSTTHAYAYRIGNTLLRFGNSLIVLSTYSTTSSDSSTQQYVYFTEDSSIFRKGVRSNAFVIDATLTPTGFSGTEDVDWENLKYVQH